MTSFGDPSTGGLAFSPASFGGFDGNANAFGSFSSLSQSFFHRLDLPTALVDFLCQRNVQPGNEDLSKSFQQHQQFHLAAAAGSSSQQQTAYSTGDHELLHALQQVATVLSTSQGQALPHLRSHFLPLLGLPSPAGASAFLRLWKSAFEVKSKEKAGYSDSYETQVKVQAATAAARLLRNIVVGENQLQLVVFQQMGAGLLSLLRLGGSLAFASDPELQPLTRSLVQLLSNLVTLNKPLQKALFHNLRLKPHLSGISEHEASERVTVVQSLLASPDMGTVEAVQILLLNCIKSSATNSSGLATSPGGRKLLGQLLTLFEQDEDADRHADGDADADEDVLDDVDDEAEDFGVGDLQIEEGHSLEPAVHGGRSQNSNPSSSSGSTPTMSRTTSANAVHKNGQAGVGAPSSSSTGKPSKSKQREQRAAQAAAHRASVQVGYAIFAHIFEYGLFRHMYYNLAPRYTNDEGEDPMVTTEQTLLLKTVDAWINAGAKNHKMHDESTVDQFRRLPLELARLSHFLRETLPQTQHAQIVDRRIVGVHQVLVLILEILIQLGMIGCEGLEEDEQFKGECEELLRLMRSGSITDGHGSENVDTVREIIETLRVSHAFAPPISPFGTRASAADVATMPAGHAATSTGAATNGPTTSTSPRLDNLNRTLIQLLGVLAFQHSPSSLPASFKEDRNEAENAAERRLIRSVQDRTREYGGLLLVLGMTNVDEGNPYIREHAIFTLRYLLQGNIESQEFVGKVQPVREG